MRWAPLGLLHRQNNKESAKFQASFLLDFFASLCYLPHLVPIKFQLPLSSCYKPQNPTLVLGSKVPLCQGSLPKFVDLLCTANQFIFQFVLSQPYACVFSILFILLNRLEKLFHTNSTVPEIQNFQIPDTSRSQSQTHRTVLASHFLRCHCSLPLESLVLYCSSSVFLIYCYLYCWKRG